MKKTNIKTKVLCFSNHKGGVGKSCSACNVGAGLSIKGHKVLVVDLDPQANLSLSLGVKDAEKTIYQVLHGEKKCGECIYNITENFDIIPSTLDLAGAELELAAEAGREVILKEAIDDLFGKYHYIIIDCAPSLGLLTTNALTASHEVMIPIQAQYLSLQGISKLTDVIEKIRKRLNKSLMVGGVFITQYDARKVLNRDISSAIEKYFPKDVFKTKIRDNVALAEAPSHGKDIFRYNSKSSGALDYTALCDEIIKRHK
ncbi:MAG: ParA family protein [Chlamydiales bacterium]